MCLAIEKFGEYFETILKKNPNLNNVICMIPVLHSFNKMLEYKLFKYSLI